MCVYARKQVLVCAYTCLYLSVSVCVHDCIKLSEYAYTLVYES